jgi:hypothetical protein
MKRSIFWDKMRWTLSSQPTFRRNMPPLATITKHEVLLTTCFMLISCFAYSWNPEDGGDMFLRNVGCISKTTKRYISLEDRTLHNHFLLYTLVLDNARFIKYCCGNEIRGQSQWPCDGLIPLPESYRLSTIKKLKWKRRVSRMSYAPSGNNRNEDL